MVWYVKRYFECNVQVYSLKQGAWRDIDGQWLNSSGIRLHQFADQHYINGVIHWLAYGENDERLIVCFDVFHETFKALKLPCNDRHCSKLFQVREFLACYDYRPNASVSNIWVMKDYGVESSWTKIYSFESYGLSPSVLAFKDGVVLMVNYYFKRINELFWFDLQNIVIMKTRVEIPTCFIRVSSYAESLILMNKESVFNMNMFNTL
ncbi:hypothetical protein K2173_007139 [Erythroxylum novogranatense]|uniref:F-box associated beta-propeller type 1 domain-containing protein n=1 Tax=Erythroxylum novogranatense TaxID=1862640 RepID=A0AAV8SYG2_9ROSI|nr:hypothetical protein K2173_007139 [Erythroxylum novogranatense]